MKRFLKKREDHEYQKELMKFERSAAGPAGTLLAYGIDVFHRGTNLTEPNGFRYAMTSCFKKAGNDAIGYTAWPWHFSISHGIRFLNMRHLINLTVSEFLCLEFSLLDGRDNISG